jgi:protein-disulfide isomerase
VSEAALTPPVGPDDHVAGPPDAPITLVEYGDFECPYCGMAFPIVRAIQRSLGRRLRFIYRHFPLRESHPHAQHAAEAAEAAAAQGEFWAMHDQLFRHQDALDDDSLAGYARAIGVDADRVTLELEEGTYTRRVRDHFRSGVRSGVNGTPTFYVNGERYDGAWADERGFLRALQAAV